MPPKAPLNSAPFESALTLTEDNDTDITDFQNMRAVWVGGNGNLVVDMADGNQQTFTGVLAGELLPIKIKRLRTATTATNIVALY